MYYQFEIFLRNFWKRANIRKRVCWNRRLRHLFFTLSITVSIKFYLHLCFKLRYYIQNGAKFLQKLALGFKNHMRNLDNFRQAVESPKSWNLMGFSPKKYIPSAKTLYTVGLSNITSNYLCVDSPNYLCYFWNHKSFFTTQLLCIFLAQTLHTFYKSSPSKCKFSDFPLLRLKFTKFLMSFFK